MELTIYQADAFTHELFSGNPAAVCPLEDWLPDALMQEIAAENNLAETAFFVSRGNHYEIRWFTPFEEETLCGHATLATAYVLFTQMGITERVLKFRSLRSGWLYVSRRKEEIILDFPADIYTQIAVPEISEKVFGYVPIEAYRGKMDMMLVFNSEREIADMVPDRGLLRVFEARGVIVTAKGCSTDFVSRFFERSADGMEDPVTGSAHTLLAPYWAAKLDKPDLSACQLSARSGLLTCAVKGSRVIISGGCRLYMKGTIFID